MQHCPRCKTEKDESEFSPYYRGGKGHPCRPCQLEYNKKWVKTPTGRRSVMNRNLFQKYGIRLDDYERMFKEQQGCCASCGTPQYEISKSFAVDHNHETGEIRGLLCWDCNTGLGSFKDDPERLEKAANYLRLQGHAAKLRVVS